MALSHSETAAASDTLKSKEDSPNKTPRKQTLRPRRPNYKHIHRFPLPLTVHPLPPLIPHNPLSVISIALSYLTYFIHPPRHEVFSAYFDPSTSSVHVTDPRTIRALWEMGFFGKGSLSRSEPTWLDREKKRRGLVGVDTSEDATNQRRVERREWKLERARKEKEAVAEQLKAESQPSPQDGNVKGADDADDADGTTRLTSNGGIDHAAVRADGTLFTESPVEPTSCRKENAVSDNTCKGASEIAKSVRFSKVNCPDDTSHPLSAGAVAANDSMEDEEHLQISNEEAFFLVYGLGALRIYNYEGTSLLPASSLLPLFRRHSYFPPRDFDLPVEPDDPFMLSYVAYHHFRSLGWVVRSGIKFGVDYLLYNRGPVFSHAEFAVVLLPSYSHPYWSQTEERRKNVAKRQNHSWWWLHCINRVQTAVQKSLILCYVEVPPSSTLEDGNLGADSGEKDIGALLKRYRVRELSIKRWVPNRSRD